MTTLNIKKSILSIYLMIVNEICSSRHSSFINFVELVTILDRWWEKCLWSSRNYNSTWSSSRGLLKTCNKNNHSATITTYRSWTITIRSKTKTKTTQSSLSNLKANFYRVLPTSNNNKSNKRVTITFKNHKTTNRNSPNKTPMSKATRDSRKMIREVMDRKNKSHQEKSVSTNFVVPKRSTKNYVPK